MMGFAIFCFYMFSCIFFGLAITALTSGEDSVRGHMAITIVCAMISGMFFGWAVWLTVKELGV